MQSSVTCVLLNVFVTLKVPTRIGCFQYSKGNKRSYISLQNFI